MKEKTLSDKVQSGFDCACGENIYIKDVKTFIKKLKEEIPLTSQAVVDKLAGDKLK